MSDLKCGCRVGVEGHPDRLCGYHEGRRDERDEMTQPSERDREVAYTILCKWGFDSGIRIDVFDGAKEEIARALSARFREGVEAAARAWEEQTRSEIRRLGEESDEEARVYGYLRAPREVDENGVSWRGFREGWTLAGYARNELCVQMNTMPPVFRALLGGSCEGEGEASIGPEDNDGLGQWNPARNGSPPAAPRHGRCPTCPTCGEDMKRTEILYNGEAWKCEVDHPFDPDRDTEEPEEDTPQHTSRDTRPGRCPTCNSHHRGTRLMRWVNLERSFDTYPCEDPWHNEEPDDE